jgi:hypothetical protein
VADFNIDSKPIKRNSNCSGTCIGWVSELLYEVSCGLIHCLWFGRTKYFFFFFRYECSSPVPDGECYILIVNISNRKNAIFFLCLYLFFFPLALQPPWALASDFQFHDHFTDCRTALTGDQLVARLIPTHRTTQTQSNRTHRHPCLEWDLNPRSQHSSEPRQFMA